VGQTKGTQKVLQTVLPFPTNPVPTNRVAKTQCSKRFRAFIKGCSTRRLQAIENTQKIPLHFDVDKTDGLCTIKSEVQTVKIAIYARISTRKQDETNQLTILRDFSVKEGWEIVAEYVDVVSGSGRKERPKFLAMMQDASQHKFDLLLFWSLDRLSREGIVKTLGYLQQFKSWNVGWRSYTQQFLDTGNAMVTDIVLSVLSAVAQQERITISERTKAGLARVRRNGSASGRPIGRPTTELDMTKIQKRRAKGESLRSIASDLGVSAALLCKRVSSK
jgi:DNA invertase Pin-like site-specific DNA recombinase